MHTQKYSSNLEHVFKLGVYKKMFENFLSFHYKESALTSVMKQNFKVIYTYLFHWNILIHELLVLA